MSRIYPIEALYRIEPYCSILKQLKSGKENAVKGADIIKLLQTDSRRFRKAVETIRRSGVCVISGASGYYLPKRKEEIERYIRRTERTAKSHFYTLKTARKALNDFNKEV